MINQTDIELVINDFKDKSKPDDRYTSFDYCYNYFRTTNDLTIDIEKSCLVLGFYLASWGMYRGSSFLLQHSVHHLKPTILYINSLDKSVWNIDVDKYDDKNIEQIILRKKLKPPCESTDIEADIDQLVFKLYGLTEEEIKIVEEGL